MEILVFVVIAAILVAIYKGFAGWARPNGCVGRRDTFLFYASIVLVSLVAFLVSSLPVFGDQIDAYTLMFYYFAIGVGVLWTLYFMVAGKSKYWGNVFIAASTLLPFWWFTLIDSFWKFIYRLLHH